MRCPQLSGGARVWCASEVLTTHGAQVGTCPPPPPLPSWCGPPLGSCRFRLHSRANKRYGSLGALRCSFMSLPESPVFVLIYGEWSTVITPPACVYWSAMGLQICFTKPIIPPQTPLVVKSKFSCFEKTLWKRRLSQSELRRTCFRTSPLQTPQTIAS